MKMFFAVLLHLLIFNILTAQISNPVNVTIELGGVGQSISVNHSAVDLVFKTTADYIDGVHSGNATNDHITVGSTSGFQVVVKATGDLSNGSGTIPLGSIIVIPSNGTNVTGISPVYLPTSGGLSTVDQTIITSTNGSVMAKFNVDYFAKDKDAYLNAVSNFGTVTYSTTITYAILPF